MSVECLRLFHDRETHRILQFISMKPLSNKEWFEVGLTFAVICRKSLSVVLLARIRELESFAQEISRIR
jgi:hypothetical protein